MIQRIVFFLLTAFIMSAAAQTSIGFKNPENKTPLKDYRLPTWGYHSWQFDASLNGNSETFEYKPSHSNIKQTKKIFQNELTSTLLFFHESEKQTLKFSPDIHLNLEIEHEQEDRKITDEQGNTYNHSKDVKNNTLSPTILLPFEWHSFGRPNQSLFIKSDIQFTYHEYNIENKHDEGITKRKEVNRNLFYDIQIGYSFGRIRNVTPVIRALRFDERLQTRGLHSGLTDDQIQQLAAEFAKHSGYMNVYDRYEKYFWQDIAESAGLEGLSMGDAFYLAESNNELIFNRYEGWTVNFGLRAERYAYITSYSVDHSTVGPFAAINWYHNISLKSQIDLNTLISLNSRATGDTQFTTKKRFDAKISANYQWMIADRITCTNRIQYSNRSNSKYNYFIYNDEMDSFYLNIWSSVNFRIEDNIILSGAAHYYFNNNKLEEQDYKSINKGWSYTLILSYYFDRRFK